MFSPKHIIILAICAVVLVAGYMGARKLTVRQICRLFLYTGLTSEVVKVFYYIVRNEEKLGGILPKTDLPFHLCSIQIIFIVIVNMAKSEKIKRFLLAFMMPTGFIGGLMALLIPTSSSLSSPVITVQYFLYHCALMILALKVMTAKEFAPNISDYFNSLKFLAVLGFSAIYINGILYDGVSNINFMYVASPPMDGLPYLTEEHGWFVYIIHYAILAVALLSLFYIKPIISAIKSKLVKKESAAEAEEREAAEVK